MSAVSGNRLVGKRMGVENESNLSVAVDQSHQIS